MLADISNSPRTAAEAPAMQKIASPSKDSFEDTTAAAERPVAHLLEPADIAEPIAEIADELAETIAESAEEPAEMAKPAKPVAERIEEPAAIAEPAEPVAESVEEPAEPAESVAESVEEPAEPAEIVGTPSKSVRASKMPKTPGTPFGENCPQLNSFYTENYENFCGFLDCFPVLSKAEAATGKSRAIVVGAALVGILLLLAITGLLPSLVEIASFWVAAGLSLSALTSACSVDYSAAHKATDQVVYWCKYWVVYHSFSLLVDPVALLIMRSLFGVTFPYIYAKMGVLMWCLTCHNVGAALIFQKLLVPTIKHAQTAGATAYEKGFKYAEENGLVKTKAN